MDGIFLVPVPGGNHLPRNNIILGHENTSFEKNTLKILPKECAKENISETEYLERKKQGK